MASAPTLGNIAAHIEQCEHQHVVAQGRGTPAVVELESLLSSTGTDDIVSRSNPYEILSVIESRLDPRSHQVGCLFLLNHVCLNHWSELLKGKQESTLLFTDFIRVACSFLSACRADDYIGYSTVSQQRLGSLCAGVGKLAISCEIPKVVICPLISGLQCMVHGKFERITPVSHLVLQACIMAKCYSKASTLLASQGKSLTVYEPRIYNTAESDILLYFYSAGLVHTGLKEYEKAFDMFLGVLVMPHVHLSDVTVDAAKKYIVISLILHGTMKHLPKYAPKIVVRNIFSECEEYMQLVEHMNSLHESNDATRRVDEFVISRQETWVADGNLGLVNVLMSIQKHRVLKKLGRIYTCIPKSRAASELGLEGSDSVDEVLLACADSLPARIDDTMDVICFEEDQNVKMRELLDLIQDCLHMKQAIDEDSHQIQCSPAFILQQETRKMASTSLK